MSQFQKMPGDDFDGFIDPENSNDKYPPLDIKLNAPFNSELELEIVENLETSFLESNLFDLNKKDGKIEEDYLSSKYRVEK